jgi:hypothetical protein
MPRTKSTMEISEMISLVKRDLAKFEHSIKNAPQEVKGEYKSWTRKSRTRIRSLEKIFNSSK